MAASYNPGTHTSPETAKVGSVGIDGLSPGRVYTVLSDPWAPTTVWLPTAITADGYPTNMVAFTSGTGAVT